MLRTIRATRYVTPLREGGSLPAIVEADDLGLYVLKFRGAGQGPLALVAELIAGEIGRALGLKVPELVLIEVDAALGRNEPDEEIRELAEGQRRPQPRSRLSSRLHHVRSRGRRHSRGALASQAVWFDAFVTNVDRTARNTQSAVLAQNALLHRPRRRAVLPSRLENIEQRAESAFPPIRDHVLLPWAAAIEAAAASRAALERRRLCARYSIRSPTRGCARTWHPHGRREARRVRRLLSRGACSAPSNFVEEAIRAHADLV